MDYIWIKSSPFAADVLAELDLEAGYIVGCREASQLGGSLLGIPPGYKANKL